MDPALAVGGGYAESKWVAEQIIVRATKDLGLRGTVIRVGQLSGDTKMGGWTAKEWVPAIVHLSQKVGCVPTRNEVCSLSPRCSDIVIDLRSEVVLDRSGHRRVCATRHDTKRCPRTHPPPRLPATSRVGYNIRGHC